jgi:hypothetical protein
VPAHDRRPLRLHLLAGGRWQERRRLGGQRGRRACRVPAHEPAGFRQYKAPNLALRRKLARRIRKLKNATIEVGPGQKVPKAAKRLRR